MPHQLGPAERCGGLSLPHRSRDRGMGQHDRCRGRQAAFDRVGVCLPV